jgi:hypothetical protein
MISRKYITTEDTQKNMKREQSMPSQNISETQGKKA